MIPLLVILIIGVILCMVLFFVLMCFEDKVLRWFMKNPRYKSKKFFNVNIIDNLFLIFILVKVNINSEQHPPGQIFYPRPIDKSEV